MSRFRRCLTAAAAAVLVSTMVGVTRADATASVGLTPMITLPGLGGQTEAVAVNRRGEVMGYSYDSQGVEHAGVWLTYDRFTSLGVEPGFGIAINNRGHVVGAGTDHVGAGFLWAGGKVEYLTYPDRGVWPRDINDRDQVVGNLDPTGEAGSVAFLWQNGRYTLLPTPAGMQGYAVGVSEQGLVVGYIVNDDWSVRRAVVWSDGVLTDLGTLGGANLYPGAINGRGDVIGLGELVGSEVVHPFVWRRGVLTDLLAGQPETVGSAFAINEAGDVIGLVGERAVLWSHGHMRYVTPAGNWGNAVALNNGGEIAGVLRAAESEDLPGRVFRWRAGHLSFITVPADATAGVAGLDDHGRLVGRLRLAGQTSHVVVWLPR